MRHRIAILTVVLLIPAAACRRDPRDVPDPQAQTAVPAEAVSSAPSPAPAVTAPKASAPFVAPVDTGSTPRSGVTPTTAVKGMPVARDITATGFGPYGIGAGQAELATAGLIGPVTTDAKGCAGTTGSSKWGSPALFFTKGRLEHVKVTSNSIKTSEDVTVGATLGAVKAAYPKGVEMGAGARGWYVASGDFGLLFRLDGDRVAAIEMGTSSTLPVTFAGGPGC
jgi:hypothetical protein